MQFELRCQVWNTLYLKRSSHHLPLAIGIQQWHYMIYSAVQLEGLSWFCLLVATERLVFPIIFAWGHSGFNIDLLMFCQKKQNTYCRRKKSLLHSYLVDLIVALWPISATLLLMIKFKSAYNWDLTGTFIIIIIQEVAGSNQASLVSWSHFKSHFEPPSSYNFTQRNYFASIIMSREVRDMDFTVI